MFVLTLIATTLAGASHENFYSIKYYSYNGYKHIPMDEWGIQLSGLYFSIPFLLILSFHEFGHYFMAKYHKLKTSLPYYIPLPLGLIGTLGAVIRLKSTNQTKKQFFDVGIAGPLAGFVVAIGFLWYGLATLPPASDIYKIHPDYERFGVNYAETVYSQEYLLERHYLEYKFDSLTLTEKLGKDVIIPAYQAPNEIPLLSTGDNLLFLFIKNHIISNPEDFPNKYELLHNPWLFAGYFALLFTALNLLPIGQLDGGHILYGLVGRKWQRKISPVIFSAFVFYAGLGFVDLNDTSSYLGLKIILYIGFLYILYKRVVNEKRLALICSLSILSIQLILNLIWPSLVGFSGWFLFAFVLARFIGINHPGAYIEEKIDLKRKVLGWIALVIFILSFIPQPLNL